MDSLIYSLNATLPVFLVIVVGYVLKQIGILNDGFVKTANKFNFVVTLPVLLFVDLSTTDIIGDFDITYVLYCALVTTVAFFGLWIAAKFLIKDKKIVGEFVQAGYRSSAAILGVAVYSKYIRRQRNGACYDYRLCTAFQYICGACFDF